MSQEKAERAILRWCRVRGHCVESCSVLRWDAHGPSVARIVVRETIAPNPWTWTVRVEAGGRVVCLIIEAVDTSYSEAWEVGAGLARALERRAADGWRL